MKPPSDISTSMRILGAVIWLVVGGVGVASAWMFGMLMFAFSMDAAKPADIPSWLEPAMIIGFPACLALAVIIPGAIWLAGRSWKAIFWTLGALCFASFAFYITCWVMLVMSLSQ